MVVIHYCNIAPIPWAKLIYDIDASVEHIVTSVFHCMMVVICIFIFLFLRFNFMQLLHNVYYIIKYVQLIVID